MPGLPVVSAVAGGRAKVIHMQGVETGAAALLAQHLRHGGTAQIMVVTGCMQPFLAPGDVIIVRGACAPTLYTGAQVGDMLVLAAGTRPLVHRLVRIDRRSGRTQLVTKGDRARHCDGALAWQDPALLGRVEAVRRGEQLLELGCDRASLACGRGLAGISRATAWVERLNPPWRQGARRLLWWAAWGLAAWAWHGAKVR
jgi:hypothetical protein